MKKIKQNVFLIFDLDGVIIDSRKNMELSWKKTSKTFKLKVPFKSYFEKIGMPFLEILKILGIKQDPKIYKCFKEVSLKKINLIKPYPGVLSFFKILKKKKIKFSIVTSKDLKRTKFILNKFKIKPSSIHCPNKNLRGKPYPDQLINCVRKNNFQKSNSYYIGDMYVDYLASKRAKTGFIFAKYGYGKDNKIYKKKIKNIKEIKNYINI